MQQAFENADMMLDQGVLAVLGKPPRRFGFGQAGGIPAAGLGVASGLACASVCPRLIAASSSF